MAKKRRSKKVKIPPPTNVSAGEVCSITTAKQYGLFYTKPFYDKDNYYAEDYNDVKTYNPSLDEKEGRDSNAVCKETQDGKIAYPMCALVHGIPYTQNPTDRSKCVIDINNFCPAERVRGGACMRSNVMLPAPVSMKTRCDEKSTDWFMLPNYHLGNKYNFVQQQDQVKCMKPCPADKVPGYIQDPVDGSSAGISANTEVDRCYDKSEYMSGKYDGTGNFCPVSWVYRLGLKKEGIIDEMIRGRTKQAISKYKPVENITKDADQAFVQSKNVQMPTKEMLAACSQLHTPERVKKAYGICKQIHDTPKSINSIVTNPNHKIVLKQACHAMFCNEDDDLVATIGSNTKPLCFDDLEDLTNAAIQKNDSDQEKNGNTNAFIEKAPQRMSADIVDRGTRRSSKIMFFSILVFLLFMLSIFMYVAWNKVGPWAIKLRCFFTFLVNWIRKEAMAYNRSCHIYADMVANKQL
jgi:hypothetical protein